MNKFFLYLFMTLSLFSCTKYSKNNKIYLIAHAGGMVDGYIRTNSLESIEQSVINGYRFIEIDLALTADSVLVAAHDWSTFNKITGYSKKKDTVPTYNEFRKRKIYNRFTPFSAQDLVEVLSQNSRLNIVTDKISDPKLLNKYFYEFRQRVIVECFSFSDYKDLKEQGYFHPLYSDAANVRFKGQFPLLLIHSKKKFNLINNTIDNMAIFYGNISESYYKTIVDISNIKLAAYTVNDLTKIPSEYVHRVDMIYTDSILPTSEGAIFVN